MPENLEQRLRIAKEALDLELGFARETYNISRSEKDGLVVIEFETLLGFAEYLLGERDPMAIAEIVDKGRRHLIVAQRQVLNAPNLLGTLSSETVESDSFPDQPREANAEGGPGWMEHSGRIG